MRKAKDLKIEDILLVPDLSQEDRHRRKELRSELLRPRDAGEKNHIIRRVRITQQPFREDSASEEQSTT